MQTHTFSIRKSFLLPLGLVVLLTLVLLISCLFQQVPLAKILILSALILPAALLFIESARRRFIIEKDGIRIRKLFRSKRITFADLTSIDTVQVRKRAFLSISSEADFIILSNSYANFGQLLKQLLPKVPDGVISEETREMADNPPEKSSDVFSAWVAVAVLTLIIYVQLRGAF